MYEKLQSWKPGLIVSMLADTDPGPDEALSTQLVTEPEKAMASTVKVVVVELVSTAQRVQRMVEVVGESR